MRMLQIAWSIITTITGKKKLNNVQNHKLPPSSKLKNKALDGPTN